MKTLVKPLLLALAFLAAPVFAAPISAPASIYTLPQALALEVFDAEDTGAFVFDGAGPNPNSFSAWRPEPIGSGTGRGGPCTQATPANEPYLVNGTTPATTGVAFAYAISCTLAFDPQANHANRSFQFVFDINGGSSGYVTLWYINGTSTTGGQQPALQYNRTAGQLVVGRGNSAGNNGLALPVADTAKCVNAMCVLTFRSVNGVGQARINGGAWATQASATPVYQPLNTSNSTGSIGSNGNSMLVNRLALGELELTDAQADQVDYDAMTRIGMTVPSTNIYAASPPTVLQSALPVVSFGTPTQKDVLRSSGEDVIAATTNVTTDYINNPAPGASPVNGAYIVRALSGAAFSVTDPTGLALPSGTFPTSGSTAYTSSEVVFYANYGSTAPVAGDTWQVRLCACAVDLSHQGSPLSTAGYIVDLDDNFAAGTPSGTAVADQGYVAPQGTNYPFYAPGQSPSTAGFGTYTLSACQTAMDAQGVPYLDLVTSTTNGTTWSQCSLQSANTSGKGFALGAGDTTDRLFMSASIAPYDGAKNVAPELWIAPCWLYSRNKTTDISKPSTEIDCVENYMDSGTQSHVGASFIHPNGACQAGLGAICADRVRGYILQANATPPWSNWTTYLFDQTTTNYAVACANADGSALATPPPLNCNEHFFGALLSASLGKVIFYEDGYEVWREPYLKEWTADLMILIDDSIVNNCTACTAASGPFHLKVYRELAMHKAANPSVFPAGTSNGAN